MKKRAVSIMVAYVLLIVIALSIAGLVYSFLRAYIPKVKEKCPDGISITIESYSCDQTERKINLTIMNRGLFTVFGIKTKVSDEASLDPYIPLGEIVPGIGGASSIIEVREINLQPGDITTISYNLTTTYETTGTTSSQIRKIQIIPIYWKNNKTLVCMDAAIIQEINDDQCRLYRG